MLALGKIGVGLTMPAWSLSGSILLALAAPGGGDRAIGARSKLPFRITTIARPLAYRLPPPSLAVRATGLTNPAREQRLRRSVTAARLPIFDPQADSVRALLKDRLARRGGGLDGRVELRLTGDGSDVGLRGGVGRIVDALTGH